MPTNDGFDPDNPLPSFLSGHAEEHDDHEQWATSEYESEYEQWSTSEFVLPGTSRLLKTSIVAMAVMAGGIAIALSLGNPGKLFADAMASLPDSSAVQRAAEQLRPTLQSAANAQDSAPTAGGAPARDEMAAAAAPADQAQTETSEPGTLLRQFQAWAANQDAQAQPQEAQAETEAQPPARPVQAFAAQIEDDSPAPEHPARKHRKARSVQSVQNARAEIRHVQKPRARGQQQNAPGQAQPVQDVRAQEQPAQNATPSFLQSLGMHQ